MEYAKIVVKYNYEKRGDLVLRSYIRTLKKIQEGRLLDGDNGFIYGIIDEDKKFHELFTNQVINYDDYFLVDAVEIFDIATMPDNRKEFLKKIMENVLFGKNIDPDYDISSVEELAKDRAVEFDAYNNCMSRINPYQRLGEKSYESYNDYNIFLRKIEEINIIKKRDNIEIERDEYEVRSYIPRTTDKEEHGYLVFEKPKVLRK